jgi:DNA transposition AAA+ family ATPase
MASAFQQVDRDAVREQARIYMSKSGITMRELADRAGYAQRTVVQFLSGARYGDSQGMTAARNLARFMEENPAPLPEFPGRLYETEATRQMDRLIEHAASGGWGTVYGGAGAQKSFLLEYRFAEFARMDEAAMVLVGADPQLSPCALLARIARGLGAPYAQRTESLRDAILYTLRKRRTPVAVVIDEAQFLYRCIDTLETLRRLGDKARGRIGILVVGNEQVLELFKPRRNVYFEQWRSRVEQEEARVFGPRKAEARSMLSAEIPGIKAAVAEDIISKTTVQDPLSNRRYVNARRLFDTIRMMQRESRREGNRRSI